MAANAFWNDHESDMRDPEYADAFKREVRSALDTLNGTEATALLLASGLTSKDLDDLGGI